MMDQEQLQRILDEVLIAHKVEQSRALDYYFGFMHTLAEAHYVPAKEFFLMGLDDYRSGWREFCLKAIGFHYNLSSEEHILNKIRQMCLTDENEFVRLTATGVLGAQSHWPDFTLILVLQNDASMGVRISALGALLDLAHLPSYIVIEEEKKLQQNGIEPDMAQLKRIIEERGPDKTLLLDI
ncbi:MAG: hypothetical protein HY862_00905 [Chloroflexi bacterium]|nr:hypothetical protein [Chloroflexota bacterium]